ncbi:MAG: hypothetical protein WB495_14305, partial [Xanthobacteraceae bacterium]
MIGVVVPAHKIIFGKAVPFDRPGARSGVKSNAEFAEVMDVIPERLLPAERLVQIRKMRQFACRDGLAKTLHLLLSPPRRHYR